MRIDTHDYFGNSPRSRRVRASYRARQREREGKRRDIVAMWRKEQREREKGEKRDDVTVQIVDRKKGRLVGEKEG